MTSLQEANVSSLGFMEFVNSFLPTLTWEQIKDYVLYEMVTDSSGVLSDDFHDANFEMFGRVMSGKEEPEPRWKRAMTIPNSMLGEAVGKLYVAKYFPDDNKAYMLTLVENLRMALHCTLTTLHGCPTGPRPRQKTSSPHFP